MGYAPLKDASYLTNGYLDTVVEGIPALKGIRLRDIPSFIRTTNLDEFIIEFIFAETRRAQRASAIILNTFEALEQNTLDALSAFLPPIYATPKTNSVVYVNFGSITVMTPGQLTEFAWGLANSGVSFLWIIRPDLVSGDNAVLAPEFLEATRGRGQMASWCPQEKVLGRPAIGGFLTHNGWNSTIESMASGVPMICWPFFAEQQTNCWYCCSHWGVGMEIDSDVKRGEVEKQVRSLMAGEEGKEMRRRAVEWKNLAAEAAKGTSQQNLRKVIDEVMLTKV
ncbi:7-deoxyloganetin glucosyltransferase [Salvia divinorum]|uniref:7-deoxyloganetin glucosyltransferase n=1 Tax=Salvia divinorum TaxID=28513 RepID=A0ABD1G8K2_SALDI